MTTEEKDLSAAYDTIAQDTTARLSDQLYQLVKTDMLGAGGEAPRLVWTVGAIEALLEVLASIAAWSLYLAAGSPDPADTRIPRTEERIRHAVRNALHAAMDAERSDSSHGTGVPRLPAEEKAGHA